MILERLCAPACAHPFPIYHDLEGRLVTAHAARVAPPSAARDAVVAHVLATVAAYGYADAATVATMVARLGLEGAACVRISQVVDAMFVYSTAFLLQSRCGRVVILSYRGTEATNLGNWLGDADIGPDRVTLAGTRLDVHAGFFRNMRITRLAVLEELARALDRRSLLDPSRAVEHTLEALYVTGHSLGGAMALLFALSIMADAEHGELAGRLRAVYTFGQPMALIVPGTVPAEIASRIFRHVLPRDVIPALPPAQWGHFTHVGLEYRYERGAWDCATAPVAALDNVRDVPPAVLALVVDKQRREASRYSLGIHCPQHYLAAVRPHGSVTEFGDLD